MPRISNIEILEKAARPTISVRTHTRVENLPTLIGESYGKMAAYLKELGEFLSDVPYVAYHNMDMQNLDVEIGFPVSKSLPGTDSIQPGFIPAGKMSFCMYRGAYSEMEAVYGEMSKWIADNNFKPVGTAYEHYYNGPEFPESEMLTMIVMPLE
ncbi:MAG TPA: GyrI-like domain-containing protein [Candidatus Acidoferrum sp.]|nr:GyrI-like domain-containing protein [Candidatus Acidoferrum sp.]